MEDSPLLNMLRNFAAPKFDLSTTGEGQLGGVRGSMTVPVSPQSEFYARGSAAPFNFNFPAGTDWRRTGEYGGQIGFRQRF